MSLLKHLPALLLGAGAAAAVYFLSREDKQQEYEHIVGPEDVTEVEDEAPADEATDAEPDAAAPETQAEAAPAPVQVPDDAAPNANPVELGKAEAVPTTEDGKLDPSKIADPKDFGNWDDTGCQG